jgi:hypothetical protein
MIPFYQRGGSSIIAFLALYLTQICRDGGARHPHQEDEVEMDTDAMVTDVMAGGNVAVIALGAVSNLGGALAEQNKGIDRCLYKAGRQICLSAKDESL